MNFRRLLALSVLMVSSLSGANNNHDHKLCNGIAEENDMRIPVGSKMVSKVDQTVFNQVIDKLGGIYAPEVKAKGGNLVIQRKWEDPTVNAYANRSGSTWNVAMFGGLARHPLMTREGFAMVLCHEIGHHLAGAPKVKGAFGNAWASNEGQSDYYAGLKCMRKFFADEDNRAALRNQQIPATVVKACESQHTRYEDRLICGRSAMAGFTLANVLWDLRNRTQQQRKPTAQKEAPVNFDTPDRNRVRKTVDAHPASQCRLDTYFYGAVCSVDVAEQLSNTDYRPGTCDRSQQQAIGGRARCWFSPN